MRSNKQSKFSARKAIVSFALEHGVKPTARHFVCSKNTVRLWMRRYQQKGNKGLYDLSQAPKHCPHKTNNSEQNKIIKLRKDTGFGAMRLVDEYNLKASKNAVHRILKQEGLVQKRPRKYHLTLPRFEYAIRELSTGAVFLSYSMELSKTWTTLTIRRFMNHLVKHGVNPKEVTLQTDLGVEFDGETRSYRKEGFHKSITSTGAKHLFNPPSCPNANADVESFHATVETEFFDRENFTDTQDFLLKANTWQNWFNLRRKNRSRGGCPLKMLQERTTDVSESIFLLEPFIVERSKANLGGQLLQGSPAIN